MQVATGLALVYLAAAARAIRDPRHEGNLTTELELYGYLQEPLLAFYINTDASTARRAHLEKQAKQLELPIKRFRAIDTLDIGSGRFDAAYVARQGLDPLLQAAGPDRSINGTVACFVSHVTLMKEIAANYTGDRVALILEDDVLLPADLLHRIRRVLQCVPPDWSLLKVSSWGTVRQSDFVRPRRTPWQALSFELRSFLSMVDFEGRVTLDKHCPDVYQMKAPFTENPPLIRSLIQSYPDYYYAGTGAYLLQVSKIPEILEHLQSQPISDVDHMMLLAEASSPAPGSYSPYQIWPFAVQLGWRHWISSVLPPSQVNKRVAVASCFLSLLFSCVAVLGFCMFRALARFLAAKLSKLP